MPHKYFVTLSRSTDTEAVEQSGCEILARYPDSIVIRCEAEQAAQLRGAGPEVDATVTAPVRLLGM